MDQRTRNRFREHALEATDRVSLQVRGCEGQPMRLFECQSCPWKGWIPTHVEQEATQ